MSGLLDDKKFEELSEIAARLRIHSIKGTNVTQSGYEHLEVLLQFCLNLFTKDYVLILLSVLWMFLFLIIFQIET